MLTQELGLCWGQVWATCGHCKHTSSWSTQAGGSQGQLSVCLNSELCPKLLLFTRECGQVAPSLDLALRYWLFGIHAALQPWHYFLQERQGLIHEQHLFTRVSTCKRLSANSFCHFVSWQPWIKAHCLAPSVLSCSEASAAHTTSTEPADSTSIGTASLAWMKAQTPGIKSWYVSPKTLPWKSALEVTSLSAWPLGLWSRKERFQSYTF